MKGAIIMLDLKERRLSLKLTLEQVGDFVGVGKSTVRKWENGLINNIGSDKIQKYAQILQISPLDIINKEIVTKKDAIDIEKALKLNTTAISYDGIELTEDEKEKVDAIIRSVLWDKLKDKKEG